jgi:hypothetical protein
LIRVVIAVAMSLVLAACNTPAAGPGSSETTVPDAAAHTAQPTPPEARTPVPGTPAPVPAAPNNESAEFATPSPAAQATPTPAPEPGLWRIQGYVVDEDGNPLDSVCIVIGPLGCQPFSPYTDERGHWFLDVAEANSIFTFYFERPGHETVWWQVRPQGPIEHNVVLKRG